MRVDDYSYLLTMFNTPRRSRLSAALQNLSGNEMFFFSVTLLYVLMKNSDSYLNYLTTLHSKL